MNKEIHLVRNPSCEKSISNSEKKNHVIKIWDLSMKILCLIYISITLISMYCNGVK